ncbi:hypothetical protein V6N13_053402 [Hibiscus sabdariffa]
MDDTSEEKPIVSPRRFCQKLETKQERHLGQASPVVWNDYEYALRRPKVAGPHEVLTCEEQKPLTMSPPATSS